MSLTPDSTSDKLSEVPTETSSGNTTQTEQQQPTAEIAESTKSTEEDEVIEDANTNTDISLPDATDPSLIISSKLESHESPDDQNSELTELEKALNSRDKVDALIRRTIQTKQKCDKLAHDNKYLQDYVGNMMNSGELLTKRF